MKALPPPKAIKTQAPAEGKSIKIADKLANDDARDIKTAHAAKHFEVELAANAYQIDLVSTAFDAYLRVLDKDGLELAFDDDSGGNLNARLVFTPPAAGPYRIVATSFNTNLGDFELTIENKK